MERIFCARIRELRGDRSQADFAKLMGEKQQNYARWEQGLCEPSFAILRRLTDLFGVSYCWLFNSDSVSTASLKHPSCMDPESVRSKQTLIDVKKMGRNEPGRFKTIDAKNKKEMNTLPDSEAKNKIISLLDEHNKEQATIIHQQQETIRELSKQLGQAQKNLTAALAERPLSAAVRACGAEDGKHESRKGA